MLSTVNLRTWSISYRPVMSRVCASLIDLRMSQSVTVENYLKNWNSDTIQNAFDFWVFMKLLKYCQYRRHGFEATSMFSPWFVESWERVVVVHIVANSDSVCDWFSRPAWIPSMLYYWPFSLRRLRYRLHCGIFNDVSNPPRIVKSR